MKAVTYNRNIKPQLRASVEQVGPNNYRVKLGDDHQVEMGGSFKHFGVAFSKAIWFSNLSEQDALWELNKARELSLVRQ